MAPKLRPGLVIDYHLLTQIFPDAQPSSTRIFDETGFKSIRLAYFTGVVAVFGANKVVFRVEKIERPDKFRHIAAFQALAATILPELVPKTFVVGKAKMSNGEEVQYSIVEFIEGVLLDEVWHAVDIKNRQSIMATLVSTMERLYEATLSGDQTQKILMDVPLISEGLRVGGPQFSYFEGATGLILSMIALFEVWGTRLSVRVDRGNGDLVIEPAHPDIKDEKPVRIEQTELKELADDIVFSFMDFEPRNIIVREVQSSPDSPGQEQYQVSAIIDWEICGFFPRGFEFFYKDMELGRGCEYYDWYRLFRDASKKFLAEPLKLSQIKLFDVMDLARRARMSRENNNVGLNMQKKWHQREKVDLIGPEEGWVNPVKREESVAIKSKADFQALVDEVLKDLGFTD